jgi:hypothetical protein
MCEICDEYAELGWGGMRDCPEWQAKKAVAVNAIGMARCLAVSAEIAVKRGTSSGWW